VRDHRGQAARARAAPQRALALEAGARVGEGPERAGHRRASSSSHGREGPRRGTRSPVLAISFMAPGPGRGGGRVTVGRGPTHRTPRPTAARAATSSADRSVAAGGGLGPRAQDHDERRAGPGERDVHGHVVLPAEVTGRLLRGPERSEDAVVLAGQGRGENAAVRGHRHVAAVSARSLAAKASRRTKPRVRWPSTSGDSAPRRMGAVHRLQEPAVHLAEGRFGPPTATGPTRARRASARRDRSGPARPSGRGRGSPGPPARPCGGPPRRPPPLSFGRSATRAARSPASSSRVLWYCSTSRTASSRPRRSSASACWLTAAWRSEGERCRQHRHEGGGGEDARSQRAEEGRHHSTTKSCSTLSAPTRTSFRSRTSPSFHTARV